jgi:hypothetical protein
MAMKSGHQDGKTEPASHATVWGFVVGKRQAEQLRSAMDQLQNLHYAG